LTSTFLYVTNQLVNFIDQLLNRLILFLARNLWLVKSFLENLNEEKNEAGLSRVLRKPMPIQLVGRFNH